MSAGNEQIYVQVPPPLIDSFKFNVIKHKIAINVSASRWHHVHLRLQKLCFVGRYTSHPHNVAMHAIAYI